jgi:Fe2+ or Zn2+ uptake regulation protein
MRNPIQVLRDAGIQPSAQRIEVATYVLDTDTHPSAEEVWAEVRKRLPTCSRATIYNTLNLFVAKGLLRMHVLAEGYVVFDPRLERHHHFIDDESGRIYDIPWDAIDVARIDSLPFEVREYQVILRGCSEGRAS